VDVERWKRIKDLAGAAIDLPRERRDAWLAEACADAPDLVPQVRTLLGATAFTEGFLDGGVADVDSLDDRTRRGGDRTGQRIGHYELLECIGAGGMGEVFRARDLALGREAALKLLPRTFDDHRRRLLVREAEASARLQHPAIATFYEAGQADGETYIAMEFVSGETLRERLRSGPLPQDEALAMTSSLLEALAHAHAAGLLHRDIKPENVILTGPRSAKLLDFSIATPLVTGDGATYGAPVGPVTGGGGLVGTIGYLAPEQLIGDPLDARTDLFQVAAVLYETLTGKPAFGRASALERLAALVTSEPDFSALAEAGVPAGLEAIVRRGLAREPARRFPSAAGFLRALHDLTDGRLRTAGRRVVAIVDFENRSGDDRFDWLGAALAEGVRVRLATVPDVVLISREKWSSAIRSSGHAGSAIEALAVSLRLGCGWLVEGSVDRRETLLCIRARLVDVATGAVVGVKEAEGALTDIFALQDRVAQTMAAGLHGAGVAVGRDPANTALEAYECYSRARVLINRMGKASLENARVLLERAIALDPTHVESLAALTIASGLKAIASPTRTAYEAAVAFADRALAIDPRHVRALVWKGYALAALGRVDEARAALNRALELDPNDTDALYFAGGAALLWGSEPRATEAVAHLQRAIEVDPTPGMWWLALGTAHRCLEHSREALYSFERARRLEGTPNRLPTTGAAAYIADQLRRDGRLDEARAEALAGIDAVERSDHAYRDTFRAHALTVLGRVALDGRDMAAAEAAFRQVLAQARGRPHPRAFGHFVVQAGSGLARATRDPAVLLEATRLFDTRETYNFDRFYGALNEDTRTEIALAEDALG
jgi:serine/threonine protein kinase/Flp pilus assembly protein TadD